MQGCRSTTEGKQTMPDIKVLTLVGSLRAASLNRQIAELAADVAPDCVTVTIFDHLGELPFYNDDIDNEADLPASVTALRAVAAEANATLPLTPQSNRPLPTTTHTPLPQPSRPLTPRS